MEAAMDLFGPGLGETRRRVLLLLKRRGPSTRHDLGGELALAAATLREHLQALTVLGLVERHGARRSGPGRPQVVFRLTPGGEALFPRREGQVLKDLARFLVDRGEAEALTAFVEARVAARAPAARARVAGLEGRARMVEVARIFSEEGYLAEVRSDDDGEPVLRLGHCPIRELVAVTRAPCRAEIALAETLIGRPLDRKEFLPDGGRSCSYGARRA